MTAAVSGSSASGETTMAWRPEPGATRRLLAQPGFRELVVEEPGLQVQVVSLQVLGRYRGLTGIRRQPDFQGIHDRPGDFVLDCKHVFELPVVGFRPELIAAVDVDELHGDPDSVASLPDAAVEQRPDAELLASLPDIDILALECERRRPGRHL